MGILKQVIVAYYNFDNDEVYSYSSLDNGKTFENANTESDIAFISKVIHNIYNPIEEENKYYKIRVCENYNNIYECKCNVKTLDGGLYSLTTYSDSQILALEENKEKLTDLLKIYT